MTFTSGELERGTLSEPAIGEVNASIKVLFLTTILPSGGRSGGEIWSQNIIDALRANGVQVDVLGYDARRIQAQLGERIVAPRQIETVSNPISAAYWGTRAILTDRPYTVEKWTGRDYRGRLREALGAQRWDLVVLNHTGLAWALDHIGKVPFVHVSHQAESELYRQHVATGSWATPIYRREARLLSTVERELASQAAEVWTLTEGDAEYFRGLGALTRTLSPVGAVASRAPETTARDFSADISMLGSWTWKPNKDGLLWFLKHVRPLLPAHWRIEVGGRTPRWLMRRAGVQFTGVVTDASAFLRRAKRIAVPSLSSVGVPIKLLDAAAAGPPVVTTLAAARTVGTLPPHVVAAASPRAFADALLGADLSGSCEGAAWSAIRAGRLNQSISEALQRLVGASAPPVR